MADPLYSGRYVQAMPLVPNDASPIQGPSKQSSTSGILAVTSGNVTARFNESRNTAMVTFPVVAGTVYPFAISFLATSTTASLIGLW
jgi:hypothetical protein